MVIRGSEWETGTVRALKREYKVEWEQIGHDTTEEKLHKVPEESIGRCGDILRRFLHRDMTI